MAGRRKHGKAKPRGKAYGFKGLKPARNRRDTSAEDVSTPSAPSAPSAASAPSGS